MKSFVVQPSVKADRISRSNHILCPCSVIRRHRMYDSVNIVGGVLFVVIAVCGDNLVQYYQTQKLYKALCDNVTHTLIGGLTWLLVVMNEAKRTYTFSGKTFLEIALCSFISSSIDVDHFISAHSLQLKDATSLTRRPWLHSTTVPLLLCSFLLFLTHVFKSYILERLSWIILAGFLSHHIRDAARRGLWLWPFGSTPPLGSLLYLILTVLFPISLKLFMNIAPLSSKPYNATLSVV